MFNLIYSIKLVRNLVYLNAIYMDATMCGTKKACKVL